MVDRARFGVSAERGLDQDVASEMERSGENRQDQRMDWIWERRESHRWASEWKRYRDRGQTPGRRTSLRWREGEGGCEHLRAAPRPSSQHSQDWGPGAV